MQENGGLTKENLKRIRAADRRAAADYSIADSNPLIVELNERVMAYKNHA
jgi:hypothetical protein